MVCPKYAQEPFRCVINFKVDPIFFIGPSTKLAAEPEVDVEPAFIVKIAFFILLTLFFKIINI